MASAKRDPRILFVGGIPSDPASSGIAVDPEISPGVILEKLLAQLFAPFGPVSSTQVPMDSSTGKPRGFGFVTFEEEEDAEDAVENMEGAEFYGRTLHVGVARPNQAGMGDDTDTYSKGGALDAAGKGSADRKGR